jgi:hypothetical protein
VKKTGGDWTLKSLTQATAEIRRLFVSCGNADMNILALWPKPFIARIGLPCIDHDNALLEGKENGMPLSFNSAARRQSKLIKLLMLAPNDLEVDDWSSATQVHAPSLGLNAHLIEDQH